MIFLGGTQEVTLYSVPTKEAITEALGAADWYQGASDSLIEMVNTYVENVAKRKQLTLDGYLMVWVGAVEYFTVDSIHRLLAFSYFGDLMLTIGLPEEEIVEKTMILEELINMWHKHSS